jgi:surface carbohydrate biosynthesis protein (TIGR04326 family)
MTEFSAWLSRQEYLFQDGVKITVKSHPNHLLGSADFDPLSVEFSNRSLSELLSEVDLVIAGGMTTAAVDTYIAAVPLLTFQSSGDVNLGPLRGIEVLNCSSNSVIDSELIKDAQYLATIRNGYQYFYTDKNLSRWKHLLKLGGS